MTKFQFEPKLSITGLIAILVLAGSLFGTYYTATSRIANLENDSTKLKTEKLDIAVYAADMEHVDETEESLQAELKETREDIKLLRTELHDFRLEMAKMGN